MIKSTGRADKSTHFHRMPTKLFSKAQLLSRLNKHSRPQIWPPATSSALQSQTGTGEVHSIAMVHRATHLVTCEHANKVGKGQHEVVVDSPAEAPASISSQQGRQEVCKGPGAGLLIGYTELVQGLHQ